MPKNIFDLDRKENAGCAQVTKNSVCFLPISIGQKYHIGEEWRETVSQMNQHFAAVVIVPVDGLHRFTEMLKNKNLSESEAERIAMADGDAWLSQVAELNKKFRIPFVLSRWSDWVTLPEYTRSKTTIDEHYNDEDSDFRSDVDIVINTFITGFINKQVKAKKGEQSIRLNLNRATDLCKRYLLEELAFVDMIKNGFVSPRVSSFFSVDHPQLSSLLENRFFMAYPFGHNSTNEDVYNCFEQLCVGGKLSFINLSKPPKQPRQRKKSSLCLSQDDSGQPITDQDVVVSRHSVDEQVRKLHHSAAVMHPDQAAGLIQHSPQDESTEVSSDYPSNQYLPVAQPPENKNPEPKLCTLSFFKNSSSESDARSQVTWRAGSLENY